MNCFCKRSYFSIKYLSLFIALIFCLIPIGRILAFDESTLFSISRAIIDIFMILLLSLFCSKSFDSAGLYIKGQEIFHKSLWYRQILPEQISRIKVTEAFVSGVGGSTPLKNKDGKSLYTMFLLKDSDIWQWQQLDKISDNSFATSYREYIICRCIYDQSVIDYLLTLNSNIIVF